MAASTRSELSDAELSDAELSNARLLFDRELAAGRLDAQALRSPEAYAALRVGGVPPRPVRMLQRARFRLTSLDYTGAVERPLLAARRALLGDDAPAPPRFLIRVDEFPNVHAWEEAGSFGTAAYERFHEALAGVPYLIAVLPRVSLDPLDPQGRESRALSDGEVALLGSLPQAGVSFGLHGRDHRTRFASPRRHSELCGLDATATEALIDGGLAELAQRGIDARDVFVPPYNRFDAAQLPLLEERFEVVCGGPESIGLLGLHSTPQWRDQAVYLPSYPPFYGTAAEVLPAVRDAIERQTGLWVPIVLHWEWEARDQWRALERLVALIAGHVVHWRDFLAAVRRSRQ
ncbi:MAG TPA: DUF2334 domain-containing protein [Solirubrobacteraceae bacterium]|jgi:peptidoglycan/xylan/chitin deacetylase (PgdA/CDA1 family)